MPKTSIISGRDHKRIYLDIVEVNVSETLRMALKNATGTAEDCHMLLDREVIVMLQGIGAVSEDLKRECNNLAHQVQTNGLVIVCPHSCLSEEERR